MGIGVRMEDRRFDYGFWTIGMMLGALLFTYRKFPLGYILFCVAFGLFSLYEYLSHSIEYRQYKEDWDEIKEMIEWL